MHVLERAKRGEGKTHRDDNGARSPRSAHQCTHEPRQGAGRLEQRKCTAYEEDRDDDVRASNDTARNSEKRGFESYRGGIRARVCPGNYDLASRRGIGATLVGAGRQNPREDRGDANRAEEEDERVGELEAQSSADWWARTRNRSAEDGPRASQRNRKPQPETQNNPLTVRQELPRLPSTLRDTHLSRCTTLL